MCTAVVLRTQSTWPPAIRRLLSFLSLLGLTVEATFSIDCIWGGNQFYRKLLGYFLVLPVAALVFYAIARVVYPLVRSSEPCAELLAISASGWQGFTAPPSDAISFSCCCSLGDGVLRRTRYRARVREVARRAQRQARWASHCARP